MRKTKLIILPTKCLNQMGFLLLFLSCPVIGDWGRIRPESEMSQWSILIEREGSCGLVRDSPGIKDSLVPDGLTECYAADAIFRNNTQSLTEEIKADFPIHESRIHRRSSRIQADAERRVRSAREERSIMRSARATAERRSVSLDRRTSFRFDERHNDRMQREVRLERSSTRRNEYRRVTRSLDRRVDSRRLTRENAERVGETSRRMSETARRRTENGRRIQESRMSQSRNERVEEQRLTRRVLQDGRNDARREPERRTSLDNRMTRERRSVDRTISPERRTREREERDALAATDRRIQTLARSERRTEPESRRIESDLSRKPEMRDDRREIDRVSPRMRDQRDKAASVIYRMRRDKPEHMTLKNGRFLDGLKTFIGQKSEQENWVSSHGDFATTCLVGAAVYFLTTRQVKSA